MGRVRDADTLATGRVPIEHAQLIAFIEEIERSLQADPPRSVLVVGEAGVGKTAVMRVLADRLRRRGTIVFEAGAADVVAGMSFIARSRSASRSSFSNRHQGRGLAGAELP